MSEESQDLDIPEIENDATPTDSSPEPQVDTPESTEDGDKKPNKVQERINKITREKYEAQRKAEEAEKKLKEYEARIAEQENRIPPEPNEDDYESHSDYIQAVKDHAVKVAKIEARQAQASDKNESDGGNDSAKKVYDVVMKSEIPDLAKLVQDPNLPISQGMVEYLAGTEKADHMLYHLVTHLDQAYEIAHMSPMQQFRELSKLEAEVKIPKAKKVTDAPSPPEPIGNNDGNPIDDSKLSIDDWIARRNAKIYGSR